MEEEIIRVKLPGRGEMFAWVTEMSGSGRMKTRCQDGKDRMIRIPGKLKKKIWVKAGDLIVVTPWEIEGDSKGDLIWKYTKPQVEWLSKNGYLKNF